jgi:hypothetical protein
MCRAVVVGMLAGTLYLAACSERPTEPPSTPDAGVYGPQQDVAPTCSITLNQLLDLAAKLLPAGSPRNNVIAALKALPTRAQDRITVLVRKSAFNIIDQVSKAYTAGKLNPQATPGDLLAFIQGMYCFIGLTPPTPVQPTDPNEFAVAVITPTSGPTIVEPPSKHGGLSLQGATLPAGVPAVTLFVSKLPDSPGPLFTSLDQFPQFYEFSVFPQVTFTKDLIAGVCQAQNIAESSSLRLAHNVGPTFGDVEVLPFANPTFLNCLDLGNVGVLGGVRGFFASLLLPTELHATSMMTTVGTGGTLKHLSPFGSVNPASNPGSIGTVDGNGQPTDGSVGAPGNVFVKVTSQNGTPIKNVPVTFGGQSTAATDQNGVAAFLWTATPGTTLTATVPNEDGCPAVTTHNAPDAYRPRVCFSPSAVTFTAAQTVPTSFGSAGWSYKQIGSTDPVPSPMVTPLAADGWAIGQAPFGSTETSPACSSLPVRATEWSLGTLVQPSTMLLRRDVFIPANTTSATIDLLIDNDVQVSVNGFDVSGGLVQHENCADILPLGPFTISASAGPASAVAPLIAGQVNKIFVRGVDRGVQSFLDVKMSLSSGGGLQ